MIKSITIHVNYLIAFTTTKMNQQSETEYFQIDPKNSFSFTNKLFQKIQFHETISTIGPSNEIKLTAEMSRLYTALLPSFPKNKEPSTYYDMSKALSLHFMSNNKNSIVKRLTKAMNKILNNIFHEQQFVFNNENVDNLSTILFYSFWRIDTCSKEYFRIESQSDLYSAIDKITYANIDVLSTFINRERLKVKSLNIIKEKPIKETRNNLRELFKSFQESNSNNNYNNSDDSDGIDINNSFIYKYSEIEKYTLPVEIIALINKFQMIKRINFSIDVITDAQINNCLIILFNIKWLFPHILEIEFDLVSPKIINLIEALYREKLTMNLNRINRYVKTTRYDSIEHSPSLCSFEPVINKKNSNQIDTDNLLSINDTTSTSDPEINNSLMDKDKCRDIIKEHSSQLNMLIIFSYFIAQIKKLKVLMIRFYDPYSKEVEQALQKNKINLNLNCNKDYSFLNMLLTLKSIDSLTIEFNALDIYNFEKIIAIINMNSNISGIRLNLFAPEEHYSPSSLFRLYCNSQLNISALFQEITEMTRVNNFNDDIDHIIIRKLLDGFIKNLECLFYALLKPSRLNELYLNMDLPSIIAGDERFTMILIKFLFNILIFLNFDEHSFQSIKIISPLLTLDDRKCPLINQFLESIDLSKAEHKKITRLTIQLKMYSVVNITKLLSQHLTCLFLGDLDHETFKEFSKYYSQKFYKESQLISLSISLSFVVNEIEGIKMELFDLYKYCPIDLIELFLYSYLKIGSEDMTAIYSLIDYNTVGKYVFRLSQCSYQNFERNKIQLFQTIKVMREQLKLCYIKLGRIKGKEVRGNYKIKESLMILRDLISQIKSIDFDVN